MQFLCKTLDTPAADLALDEALLELAERGQLGGELLRLWDARRVFVVLGRSGRYRDEVHIGTAEADAVPILRRSSGGGTVMAAPGCLFYSLVLSMKLRPELRMVDQAHQFVMQSMVQALHPLEPRIASTGTCDLVIGDQADDRVTQRRPGSDSNIAETTTRARKVGGNSLRVRRDWLIYHGTLLLDMDLSLISRYLKHPPREPDYRRGGAHGDFVANLNLSAASVRQSLIEHWDASESPADFPADLVDQLLQSKYANIAWNLQR